MLGIRCQCRRPGAGRKDAADDLHQQLRRCGTRRPRRGGGKGVGLGGLPGRAAGPAGVRAEHRRPTRLLWMPTSLRRGIQELAVLAPQAAPQDYEEASERIRALFTGGTMPAEVAAELGAAYRSLGNARHGCGGAVLRHGRGPRLGQLRRATGNLPQCPRGGGPGRGGDRVLGFPVDGARHGLPGP